MTAKVPLKSVLPRLASDEKVRANKGADGERTYKIAK